MHTPTKYSPSDNRTHTPPRHREELSERQARVGIIANPNSPIIADALPREVWTRWPTLRSARRRQDGSGHADTVPPPDPVLSGDRLRAYARDMRAMHPPQTDDPAAMGPADDAGTGRNRALRTLFWSVAWLLLAAAVAWTTLAGLAWL